jgi:hypothetical protein
MIDNDYYPRWLSQGLLENSFAWNRAQTSSMPAFLAQYTLHDSPWIGFWFGAGEPIALIRWDTFWHKDRIPFPGSNVAEWPLLLMKFTRLYQYLISTRKDLDDFVLGEVIEAAESNLVEPQQREALLAASLQLKGFSDDYREQFLNEKLYHTVFQGTYKQQIHLFHGGEVQFLCIDQTGIPISIPGLS